MDAYEATKVVLERIQAVDPDNAAKIMGLLLLQDNGEKEMIRLAFGPDSLLLSVVAKARAHLSLAPPPPPPTFYGADPQLLFVNDSPKGADFFFPDAAAAGAGHGWRPCLYFARGYCKNGAGCRFVHDDAAALDAAVEQQCHDLLLRSRSPRHMSAAFPFSPTSSMNKCSSFLLHPQPSDAQRAAAEALMLGGEDAHRFITRSPRMIDRSDLAGMASPGARQIYLTFPADSTFCEEDVSHYFSTFGPVQDVRIPYQQKRMFGFVTFVFPETVRIILAKGNPHFVCSARVLVKPYKEKGKVLDKKQQQGERGDFSGCSTPTGDAFDLQQLGAARMVYGCGLGQEVMRRRRLEELQQAVELQQAIEMQSRRFMGLQLLDLKSRGLRSAGAQTVNNMGLEQQPPPVLEEKNAASAAADKEMEESTIPASSNEGSGFQESVDHNLPDSPFASPTKSSYVAGPFAATLPESDIGATPAPRHNNVGHLIAASSQMPPAAPLDMSSFKSCFFQVPRFSGHGAVGM